MKQREDFLKWIEAKKTPVKGGLIFAGSGSGKTHFVSQHPNMGFIDGDKVVSDLYPDEPEWWLDPKLNEATQERTTSKIAEYMKAHPEEIILWWADINRLHKKLADNSVPFAAVIPPKDILTRNQTSRKEGPPKGHPTDVFAEAELCKKIASELHVQVFERFEDAVSFIRGNKQAEAKNDTDEEEDRLPAATEATNAE